MHHAPQQHGHAGDVIRAVFAKHYCTTHTGVTYGTICSRGRVHAQCHTQGLSLAVTCCQHVMSCAAMPAVVPPHAYAGCCPSNSVRAHNVVVLFSMSWSTHTCAQHVLRPPVHLSGFWPRLCWPVLHLCVLLAAGQDICQGHDICRRDPSSVTQIASRDVHPA
jgi:hypothetical protein